MKANEKGIGLKWRPSPLPNINREGDIGQEIMNRFEGEGAEEVPWPLPPLLEVWLNRWQGLHSPCTHCRLNRIPIM
jgi:hypothetical protein